jgi:hypothetical protein
MDCKLFSGSDVINSVRSVNVYKAKGYDLMGLIVFNKF